MTGRCGRAFDGPPGRNPPGYRGPAMKTETCESCGHEFGCGAEDSACWCSQLALGPERQAILRAAIRVFAHNGYFNSKVADIAHAAGATDWCARDHVGVPSLVS